VLLMIGCTVEDWGGGGVTGGGFFSGNTGQMYVTLKPREERGVGSEAVLNRLRPQLARIEGLQVFLFVEQDFRFGGRGGRGAGGGGGGKIRRV
jgi:multidrug efflux pump subunit AcrB